MSKFLKLPKAALQSHSGGFDGIVLRQGADAVHIKKRPAALRMVDESASTQIARTQYMQNECVTEVQETESNLEELQAKKQKLETIISRFPAFRQKSTTEHEKLFQDLEDVDAEVEVEEQKLTRLRRSLAAIGLFDAESLLDQVLKAIEEEPAFSKDCSPAVDVLAKLDIRPGEYKDISRLWAAELACERLPAQDPEYDCLLRSELLKEAEQARLALGDFGKAISDELGMPFRLLPHPASCAFHEAAALIHGATAALDVVRCYIEFNSIPDLYDALRWLLDLPELKTPSCKLVGMDDSFQRQGQLAPRVRLDIKVDGFICALELRLHVLSEAYERQERDWKLATALLLASAVGRPAQCITVLDHGVSANVSCAFSGLTPLHLAAARGSYDIVDLLLNWKADALLMDSSGQPAHQRALLSGHTNIAARLLETLQDVGPEVAKLVKRGDLTSKHQQRAEELLCWAQGRDTTLGSHATAVFSGLANIAASLYLACDSPGEIVHKLSAQGDRGIQALQAYMASLPQAARQQVLARVDTSGWLPLDHAAGQEKVADLLRPLGAKRSLHFLAARGTAAEICEDWPHHSSSMVRNAIGETALHAAVQRADAGPDTTALVQALLDRNAELTLRNAEGLTVLDALRAPGCSASDVSEGLSAANRRAAALFDAAQQGDARDVQALILENPKLLAARTEQGYTVLDVASGSVARALQEAGAQRSLLHCIATGDLVTLEECLTGATADLEERDSYGNTPLHIAAQMVAPDICAMLLRHRASVHARNRDGNTPLSFILATSDLESTRLVCQMLLEHKASVSSVLSNLNNARTALATGIPLEVHLCGAAVEAGLVKPTVEERKLAPSMMQTGAVAAEKLPPFLTQAAEKERNVLESLHNAMSEANKVAIKCQNVDALDSQMINLQADTKKDLVSQTASLKAELESKKTETLNLEEQHRKLLAEVSAVEQQNQRLRHQVSQTAPRTLETAFQRQRRGINKARHEWCQLQITSKVRQAVFDVRDRKLNALSEHSSTLKQHKGKMEGKINSLRTETQHTKLKLENISPEDMEVKDDQNLIDKQEMMDKQERLRSEIEQRKGKYTDIWSSTKQLERSLKEQKAKTLLESLQTTAVELQQGCETLREEVSSAYKALGSLGSETAELDEHRLPAAERRIKALSAEEPTKVLPDIQAVLIEKSTQPQTLLAVIRKLRRWLSDPNYASQMRDPQLLDIVVQAANQQNIESVSAEARKLLIEADVNQSAVTQLLNAIKLGTQEALLEAHKIGEAQHVMWTHPDVMSKAKELVDKIESHIDTQKVFAQFLKDLSVEAHDIAVLEEHVQSLLGMPSSPDEELLVAAAGAMVAPRLWRVASQVESWAKRKPADRQDWIVSHETQSGSLAGQLDYAARLAKRFNADDKLLTAAQRLKQQHGAEAEALRDLELALDDGTADTIEGSLQRAEKAGLAEECKKVREALAQQDVAILVERDDNDLSGLQDAIEYAALEGVPSPRLYVARQRAKDMQTLRSEYGIGTHDVLYATGYSPGHAHRNALRGSVRGANVAREITGQTGTGAQTQKNVSGGSKKLRRFTTQQNASGRGPIVLPTLPPDVQIPTLVQACIVTMFLETETRGGNIDEMLQGLSQAQEVLSRIQMLPDLNQRMSSAVRRAGDRVLKELDDSIHQLGGYNLERWVEKVHALGLRDESVIEVEKHACEVAADLEEAVTQRNLQRLSRGLRRLDGDEVRVKYKGRSDAETDIHGFKGGQGNPLVVASLAENGLAETVGVRPGHLVTAIVPGDPIEALIRKPADHATSALHGAKEVRFRIGGLLLPDETSQTVRQRVQTVRTQATKLVKNMLSAALGHCDIKQLESCMEDLQPQGLLSANFDAEVAVCTVVGLLEEALENNKFFKICEHLKKAQGSCIAVKYSSEDKISSDVSMRSREKTVAELQKLHEMASRINKGPTIVIDHFMQNGPAHRAGLVSGSSMIGTEGHEGEWVDLPRGIAKDVIDKLDETAEHSPEGVTVFFLKPGLLVPDSAPALLCERLRSVTANAQSTVIEMVDQAILGLDEADLRSRIEPLETLRLRPGWQIWREFEIFYAVDTLSRAVAGKDDETLLHAIDTLNGLEWEFGRTGPPLAGASEVLMSRLHSVKEEALAALRPSLMRGIREMRADLLAKYPPRMQRLRVAEQALEVRCAQARMAVKIRQEFLLGLKTQVTDLQRMIYSAAQGNAHQEDSHDGLWLTQGNYEEAVGLTDKCEKLLEHTLGIDDPIRGRDSTAKLKQLVQKSFKSLPEMPEDAWGPAAAALLQNAVEERGGSIGGAIWIMLGWTNEVHASPTEYELHVTCCCGTELCSTRPRCPTCLLSFDKRASIKGKRGESQGVESIFLPGGMWPGDGTYFVKIVARSGPRVPMVVVIRVGPWQRAVRVRADAWSKTTSLIAFECKDGRPVWEIHHGYLKVPQTNISQLRRTDLAEVKEICEKDRLVGFTVPASYHLHLGSDPGQIDAGWMHSAWTLVSPKPKAVMLDQPMTVSISGTRSGTSVSGAALSRDRSKWAPLDSEKGTFCLRSMAVGPFWSINLGEQRYIDKLLIEWLPGAWPHSFSVVEVGGSEDHVLAEMHGAGPCSTLQLGVAVQMMEIRVLECHSPEPPEEENEGPSVCEVHYDHDAPPPAAEIQGLKIKGDHVVIDEMAVEDSVSALPPPALVIHARPRRGVDISGTYLRRSDQWQGRPAYEKREEEISETITERNARFAGVFIEEKKKGKTAIRAIPQSLGIASDPLAHISKLEEMMWEWMSANEKSSCVAHLGLMVNPGHSLNPQTLEEEGGVTAQYQMSDSENYARLGKADVGNAFDSDWTFPESWGSTPIELIGDIAGNAIAVYRLEIEVSKPTYALRWQPQLKNDTPDVLGHWVIDPKGFRDDHVEECAAQLTVFVDQDVPHPAVTDHQQVWMRRACKASAKYRPDPTLSVLGVSTGTKCEVTNRSSGVWHTAVVYEVKADGAVDLTVAIPGNTTSEELWKGIRVTDLRQRRTPLAQLGIGPGAELLDIKDNDCAATLGKLSKQRPERIMQALKRPGPHVLYFAWETPGFALQTVKLIEGENFSQSLVSRASEYPVDAPQVPGYESGSRWVSYRKLNYPIPDGMKKRTNSFKQFNVNL